MNYSKVTGQQAEKLALKYLLQQHVKLIQRNFYSRFGEIDLIMQDQDTLIFVEVKQRKSGINTALESITIHKQKKLIKTAQYYLLKCGRQINCRFDAVVLDYNNTIKWLKNIIIL